MAEGDDLEDDFVIDDLVSLSEDEVIRGRGFFSNESSEGEVKAGKDIQPRLKVGTSSAVAEKKRKRREKEKEKKAKKRKLTRSVDIIEQSIAARSPNELSHFLSAPQAKTFPKMTAMELEDMRIPATSIADTTAWIGPRTLDQLAEFIINTIPLLHKRLSQKPKNNGSPTLLFVTGAALRVADVTRVLKDKRLRGEKGGEVAKLFAKHFKLAEHVAYLRRTKIGAAVGTPGRIGKLLCETDALTISALSHIILDVTYQDSKKRSLLDIPETRDEIFKTVLGGPVVWDAIKAGKIQVVIF